jgi:hypothetical protein
MLSLRATLITLALCASAAGALAQEALIGARDTARPGGSYATLPSADAAACARLCTMDGLCMAWTQRADATCELKAVVPAPVAMAGATSGLSTRAPDFARRLAVADTTGPQHEIAPEPVAETRSSSADTPAELALLGGLTDANNPLRPRFSGSP